MAEYVEINGMKIFVGEDRFSETDVSIQNKEDMLGANHWYYRANTNTIENKVLGKEIVLSKIKNIGLLKKVLLLLETQFSTKDFYEFSLELNKVSERVFDRSLDRLVEQPEDFELNWSLNIESY